MLFDKQQPQPQDKQYAHWKGGRTAAFFGVKTSSDFARGRPLPELDRHSAPAKLKQRLLGIAAQV
jgi:hypothetical protein